MRRGRIFEDNKEKISIFSELEDDLFGGGSTTYIVENVYAVFHPVIAASNLLTYNSGVLSQTQADADWRVILDVANSEIEKAYTLVRNRGETDEKEMEIVDVLAFGGEMHLFVSEEGIG